MDTLRVCTVVAAELFKWLTSLSLIYLTVSADHARSSLLLRHVLTLLLLLLMLWEGEGRGRGEGRCLLLDTSHCRLVGNYYV